MCKFVKLGLYWVYRLIESKTGVGSSDNYAYLVIDDKSKDAVIIDPANPEEYGHSSAAMVPCADSGPGLRRC
jgi:hypothetical protein